MENKHNFLRNWLSLISNPKSNIVQVLQDRFQSKLDDCFSEDESSIDGNKILYPSNNFIEVKKDRLDLLNSENPSNNYQDENGSLFEGKVINRKRHGRGILSMKEYETNHDIRVEGFYHEDLLVGNVLRITRGTHKKLITASFFTKREKHLVDIIAQTINLILQIQTPTK